MPTLYRSPNLLIDKHEWYVAVEQRGGRPVTVYRFRPASGRPTMWSNIAQWQGRKPKGLNEFFRPYRRSISVALESVNRRAAS